MFQFPRLLILAYVFSKYWPGFIPAGFPHSGIPGLAPACGYPGLFAACHALLHPLTPRHPPYALLACFSVAGRLRLVSFSFFLHSVKGFFRLLVVSLYAVVKDRLVFQS